MKIVDGSEENVCPFCGSEDIDFGVMEPIDGDSIFHDCTCNNCDETFRSFYGLTFESHWVEDNKEIPAEVARPSMEF